MAVGKCARDWLDTDTDGIGNFMDRDADGDGVGDNLDDDDNDGIPDTEDRTLSPPPEGTPGLRRKRIHFSYQSADDVRRSQRADLSSQRPPQTRYPPPQGDRQAYA